MSVSAWRKAAIESILIGTVRGGNEEVYEVACQTLNFYCIFKPLLYREPSGAVKMPYDLRIPITCNFQGDPAHIVM